MHVEVVVLQGVVLVPVQSDGVVRRIDDLRPPLRARSRRVERGRRVRVSLALILPAPRRVRDVQVEYLLREVLQRAPRLVLGGDPERLPGAVLLLGAAAGVLLDAPGGEDPPAVGEDARVQLRILVQPLDEVGESPERVELEVVDRGSVHSTVLSHHQVQLFLLFGVAVGVVVLVVLVIVLIGSRLVVLVLVLLRPVAIDLVVWLETLGVVAVVLDISLTLLTHRFLTHPLGRERRVRCVKKQSAPSSTLQTSSLMTRFHVRRQSTCGDSPKKCREKVPGD